MQERETSCGFPFCFCKSLMDSKLRGTCYLSRFDAAGADAEPFDLAVLDSADVLKVRKPASLCPGRAKSPRAGVNVSYILSKLRTFAADVANISHNSKEASCGYYTRRSTWSG